MISKYELVSYVNSNRYCYYDESTHHHSTIVHSKRGQSAICQKAYLSHDIHQQHPYYFKQDCQELGDNILQTNGCNENCTMCTGKSYKVRIVKRGPVACLLNPENNQSMALAIEESTLDTSIIVPKCLSINNSIQYAQESTCQMDYLILLLGILIVVLAIWAFVFLNKKNTNAYKRVNNNNENNLNDLI